MVASSSSSSSSFVVLLLLLVACTTMVTAFTSLYDENALYPGQRLRVRDALRWGNNRLVMQPDCNLCYYVSGWCSKSNGGGNDCSAYLNYNGNLAVYVNNGKIRWQTKTGGARGDYVLLVQEDNNAVLYGRSIWSTRKPWRPATATTAAAPAAQQQQQQQQGVVVGGSSTAGVGPVGAQPAPNRFVQNVLYEGESLLVNQELRSKSFRLIMQEDCNLVLYNAYDTLWTSDTSNRDKQCYAVLGKDGNLVIYGELGAIVWSSGSSSGNGDYILILQNDGVAMIYSKVLWSALTFKPRGLTTNSTSTSNISMVTGKE